MPENQRVIVVI